MFREVLRTLAVTLVVSWPAHLFSVEEDVVDPESLQPAGMPRQLQQHRDAGPAVICSRDGLVLARRIGVLLRPEATVPVRPEQDSPSFGWILARDDVDQRIPFAALSFGRIEPLQLHARRVRLHGGGNEVNRALPAYRFIVAFKLHQLAHAPERLLT
jgi:hypothetical protein